jgi:hypothetical protein
VLLAHVSGAHYALIISETFKGAHAATGDVAVAYLNHDPHGWRPGCGGYEYSSRISAPEHKGDLMRIMYTGWMIPDGPGQKRRDFHISAALSRLQGKLSLQPEIQLPDCGS